MNFQNLMVLAQNDDAAAAAAAGGAIVFMLVYLAVIILTVAGIWKTFSKAGKPGWAAIIPIYNGIILAEVAGKPLLWGILLLIPCINIIIAILLCMDVAKNFGKSQAFGLGLAFLGPIFWPMLGFGSAKYQPVAKAE